RLLPGHRNPRAAGAGLGWLDLRRLLRRRPDHRGVALHRHPETDLRLAVANEPGQGYVTPKTDSNLLRRRVKLLAGVSVVATALLILAGCGSSSSSKPSSGPAGPGVAAAQARVAQLEQPTTAFPPPGPPLRNVRSLAGKTVWYIPITQKVEFFNAVSGALGTALGQAGVHLRTCSGEANPSATAACVTQATASKAGAIIVDAIPIVVAANAFDSAQAKHIPILVTDQFPPPPGLPGAVRGPIGTDKLAYTPLSAAKMLAGI